MPAFGPPQTVGAIPRLPSRHGLLTAIEATGGQVTPDPQPDQFGAPDPNGERWLNGIQYRMGEGCGIDVTKTSWPFGCGMNTGHETEDKTGHEGDQGESNLATTNPFLAQLFEECSTFGWDANDYVGRAQRTFEACESAIVEYEFWTGTAIQHGHDDFSQDLPDPISWLASNNAQVQTTGATTPGLALAALEDGLSACCGEGGFIHVPYGSVNLLQERNLLIPDGPIYRTVNGNVVVAGKGYPGTDFVGDPPDTGETWIYATGPVRYWRTPKIVILPGTFAQALVRDDDGITNSLRFHAERAYLVDFDRCCHFAAQMSLTDI